MGLHFSMVLIDFDISLDIASVLVLVITIFERVSDGFSQRPLATDVWLEVILSSGWNLLSEL